MRSAIRYFASLSKSNGFRQQPVSPDADISTPLSQPASVGTPSNAISFESRLFPVPVHRQGVCESRTTEKFRPRLRFRGLILSQVGTRRKVSLRFKVLALLGFSLPEAFPFPDLSLSASSRVLQEGSRSGYLSLYFRVSKNRGNWLVSSETAGLFEVFVLVPSVGLFRSTFGYRTGHPIPVVTSIQEYKTGLTKGQHLCAKNPKPP